jgi:hypothetical protein
MNPMARDKGTSLDYAASVPKAAAPSGSLCTTERIEKGGTR